MTLKRLFLRGGPVVLLSLLTLSTGYFMGNRIPDDLWWLTAASALIFLVLLQIFKQVPRLNLILLLGFSLTLGGLLHTFDLGGGFWFPGLILLLGLVLALIWAYMVGIRLSWLGVLLYPLTLFYLLGWLVMYIVNVQATFELIWAGCGIFLFLGLGVFLMTQARYVSPQSQVVPIVSDLFVIYGNLFWASAMLISLIPANFPFAG